jgi:hypothetical protein
MSKSARGVAPPRALKRPGSKAPRRARPGAARVLQAKAIQPKELKMLRDELKRRVAEQPIRWNASPEDVQRSVAKLVLTLVELIRKLLERQAIRRMEKGTLTDEQVENVGVALMRLEQTLHDMARQFGLTPDELKLELGPLGKLL